MLKRIAIVALLAAIAWPAVASDSFRATFVNGLSEEVVAIHIKFATDGEPRLDTSRVSLRPNNEFRLGVQGVREPVRIVFDLGTASYEFSDLSPLDVSEDGMRLEVEYRDGSPRLVQYKSAEATREAEGVAREYLTAENRVNAVDKDDLVEAEDMSEVETLVKESVDDAKESLGELSGFDLEAGPIWNNDNAKERCPEVVDEWNEDNPGLARWTGHWTTTVPGTMSVCNCIKGAAGLDKTLFEEADAPTRTLIFPVIWGRAEGVGRAAPMRPDTDAVAVSLRFKMPDDVYDEAFKDLLDAIGGDGFRPWAFTQELLGREDEAMRFADGDKGEDEAREAIVAAVLGAREKDALRHGTIILVNENTYKTATSGEDAPTEPGVLVLFSPSILEVVFIPDSSYVVR